MKNCLLSYIIFFPTLLFFTFANANIKVLEQKANAGDVDSQFRLALKYDFGKDLKQAVHWYKKAAEQGHAVAQNSMGSLYQAGDGVDKNYTEAVRWYEKSANQGHAEAYNNLAYMYDLGLGVTKNESKAIDLYKIAAEKGFVKAFFNLGISFANGEGVKKDNIEAYKWLDLARFYTQKSKDMQLKWRVRAFLDQLKKEMSRKEIKEGKRQSKKWHKEKR